MFLDNIYNSFENMQDYLNNSISNTLNIDPNDNVIATERYNRYFSMVMTNLFEDTEVFVFESFTDDINAFTITGAPEFSKEWATSSKEGDIRYRSTLLKTIIRNIEVFKNAPTYNSTCIYNPETERFKLNFKQVTVFITTGAINYLTERECIAFLLHEIGHNTQVSLTCLETVSKWILAIPIIAIIQSLIKYLNILDNSSYSNIGSVIISIYLSLEISSFLTNYIKRRQEIYSDEFAIKIGYGKDLQSALRKLRTLQNRKRKKMDKYIPNNILDTIKQKYYQCLRSIYDFIKSYWMGSYPSMDNRIILNQAKIKAAKKLDDDRTNEINYIEPEYKY